MLPNDIPFSFEIFTQKNKVKLSIIKLFVKYLKRETLEKSAKLALICTLALQALV
jgi:hypothetical protein